MLRTIILSACVISYIKLLLRCWSIILKLFFQTSFSRHPNPVAPPNEIPPISVSGSPDSRPSSNGRLSRQERILQLHSLLIILSPIASRSSPDYDSTFNGLNASMEALIHSLDSVPIPPPTLARAGQQDSAPPFSPHPQSLSGEGHLPPYEHS